MAKVNVYNITGQVVKDVELNDSIYAVMPNEGLIHQAVVAQRANARNNYAHTKDRSEVSGGGKKPWRQKGTGRARHGSTRSPIWIGGGVTFGPTRDRNFSKSINKKMKRKALFMTLSDKVTHDKFVIVDDLKAAEVKTKTVKDVLAKLPVDRNVLLVLPNQDENIWRSVRNLSNVKVLLADSLNVVDILHAQTMVLPEASLEVIEKVYLK